MSGYSEPIDEKYHLSVNEGVVEITRNGEEWLVNPEGAKAWISVADELEKLRKERRDSRVGELQELAWSDAAEQITEHLTEVWGWLPDEPEAVQLGEQLASVLHLASANTNTHPLTLLSALLTPVKTKADERLF